MTKAVFTTKVSPVYDDLPEFRYHFPKIYLNRVNAAVNDWIIYYEPRRSTGDLSSSGGRQAYFATARVESIVADPILPDHYYAQISNFTAFTRAVPFKVETGYYESKLEKDDGSTNRGVFGHAVRSIPDKEYDLIIQTGLKNILEPEAERRNRRSSIEEQPRYFSGFSETQSEFLYDVPLEQDRKIVEQLVSRPFRDKAFSALVKSAYSDTCAMTGLKIINGGGRSEVQAAHIRPVADKGPDSVRNGIALSGTIHWMFDRGLISVDEDYGLLLAKGRIPDTVNRLLGGNHRLLLPPRLDLQPHQQFLNYHRREVFKG